MFLSVNKFNPSFHLSTCKVRDFQRLMQEKKDAIKHILQFS